MGLLARNLQEFLLHVDESLHAAPQQIGNSMRRGPVPDPLFHAAHQDFVLFLAQIEQDFLPFDEVRYALPGHFAENGGGRVMWVGQLLPHGVHYACILPHGEIQKHPLRGKEALYSLLRPTR